jgi:hypothetical protein
MREGEARSQLPRACTRLSLVHGLRTEVWSGLPLTTHTEAHQDWVVI